MIQEIMKTSYLLEMKLLLPAMKAYVSFFYQIISLHLFDSSKNNKPRVNESSKQAITSRLQDVSK